MKSLPISGRPLEGPLPNTVWFARLVLPGLLVLLLAGLGGGGWIHRHAGLTVATETSASMIPKPRPAGWYFRTGQWQADARTLVAALHYLVSTEPA